MSLSSNTLHLHSRAAAQTSLHKMYTFVYRTFIKFIFFCWGQALFASSFNALTGLSCYVENGTTEKNTGCFNALTGLSCYVLSLVKGKTYNKLFQCPLGLELLLQATITTEHHIWFQCPLGLELLRFCVMTQTYPTAFQCPLGLELLPSTPEPSTPVTGFQCPLGLELLLQECPIF